MLTREDHIDFVHALGKGTGSATAFCLAITVIWPVGALLMYHVRVSHAYNFGPVRKNIDQLGLAPLPQCDDDRTGMAPLFRFHTCLVSAVISHHSTLRQDYIYRTLLTLDFLLLRRFGTPHTRRLSQGRLLRTLLPTPVGRETSPMFCVDRVDILGYNRTPWQLRTSGW
jgi:hypothetical protein